MGALEYLVHCLDLFKHIYIYIYFFKSCIFPAIIHSAKPIFSTIQLIDVVIIFIILFINNIYTKLNIHKLAIIKVNLTVSIFSIPFKM